MKKSALEIKKLVKEKLLKSNIILWGYKEQALEFYHAYKECFSIKACVTEQKNHPEYLAVEEKIPIIAWDDYAGEKNDYIIVCASPFIHVENQILASGLHIFEEYVDGNLVKAILSDKKIAIIAGACQVSVVSDFLNQMTCFTDEYQCFRFSTHHWASRWSLKSLSYLKSFCDVYICMKHEKDNIKFFSKAELPENCKIITVPYALLRIYWPQVKSGWKNALNEYFEQKQRPVKHGPFEYGDANINRMIKEGKSADAVVEALTSEDFYSEEQVLTHIDTIMRLLEYEEYGCDIKLTSYIKEHYRESMIYRDMVHPQPMIIWEIIRQILDILRIIPSEAEKKLIRENKVIVPAYDRHCTEIPVYPSVARALELNWWSENIRYDVTFLNGVKKMTFEEYIRSYYRICRQYKELTESW